MALLSSDMLLETCKVMCRRRVAVYPVRKMEEVPKQSSLADLGIQMN